MFRLAIFALAISLASASLEANWVVYKHKHSKTYLEDEDNVRSLIWQSNLQKIEQHNELYAQGVSSYYVGENQFTDMTFDEFSSRMTGLKVNTQRSSSNYQTLRYKASLPDSVDWRTKGYVTPVKNQLDCESCWAFSTTGSVEGQHFKATGKLVSLSESNLVDCSQKFGNGGCTHGGLMDNAFRYIIYNKGIDTEKSYPYKPVDEKCKFKREDVGATISSYKDVESFNEDALQSAVAEVGPVSVSIDAEDSFRHFKGGVYDEPACNSTALNHGVLVVGYGSESGNDFWIVKNSWGTTWGDKGYILMSRNKNNQCGIATMASYPIV